jgi:hypothetical protein
MNSMKEAMKKITPAPLLNIIRDSVDGLRRLPEWPAATLHPWRRASIERLQEYKGRHSGERCFIIGNGPSLNKTDLSHLRGEYTFGLNRIYLMFPKLGFKTTYFLSMNDLVIEQCAEEIRGLSIPKFISWRARRFISPTPDMMFLYTTYTGPKFSKDVSGRLWEGATVTYVTLQVAFYMGFQQVSLIGVDHNFATQGKANSTVVSQGDDPNHFNPSYFGKGFRWQLPDLETSERAYTMAREAYESSGREVIDATVGGKLTVFPKVSYDSLF